MNNNTGLELLQLARGLAPLLEREAEVSRRAGTASPAAVEALRGAGMFGLVVPQELGGAELGLSDWSRVIAELSYADGALGWTALANSTVAGFASRWLGDEAVKAIFPNGPEPLAGQFTARGSATVQDKGVAAGGRYSFGSGSGHATWIGGGARLLAKGEPVLSSSGMPVEVGYFVPRSAVRFLGGWDVMGLQATGSYDYEIDPVHIDDGFFFRQDEPARRGSGAGSATTAILGVAGHGGWALGVARRALDEALRAATKPQTRVTGANAEREGFLHDIAASDAALTATRLALMANFDATDARAQAQEPIGWPEIAALMQATRHATRVALDVVRSCFEWVGVGAIRPGVMQRAYLDMSVAALHLSQTRETYVGRGRLLVAEAQEVPAGVPA